MSAVWFIFGVIVGAYVTYYAALKLVEFGVKRGEFAFKKDGTWYPPLDSLEE